MAYTPAQRKVIRAIRREAVRRYSPGGWTKAERRKLRSAFLTGRVESNFQNLAGGDADSAGWRQERSSLYENPTNLQASVRRYFGEADKLYQGDSPASLSGRVQRPAAQYLHRYGQHRGEGIKLARKTIGGTPVAPARAGKTTTRRKVVIPGVDRSEERKALLLGYLEDRGKPGALLDMARQLPSVRDTRERSIKVKRRGGQPAHAQGGSGRVRGGGGWAGTKGIAYAATEGLPRGSQKRGTKNTATGGVSDHYVGNRDAYAIDVPAAGPTGDRYARQMAQRLGLKGWKPGSYTGHVITAAGGKRYRVQLLWKVEGHFDHVHIGVERV